MEIQKILTGVLAKTLNLGDGEIAELIKDGEGVKESDVIQKILDLDVQRVEKIKTSVDGKEKFQDGYKKGKEESLSKLEKQIKEKYGIQSEKLGVELVEEIITEKSKPVETEEETVKRSKTYQDLETRLKGELKTQKETYEQQITDINSQTQREKTLSVANKKALDIFAGLEPVLPTSKQVADNQIGWFLKSMEEYDFDVQDDRIVVMKDGKVVQDGHGNSRTFDDIVKEKAGKFFEFKKNNGSGNDGGGGNPPAVNPDGYPEGVQKPKNLDELTAILNDPAIDSKAKVVVAETYDKENKV